MAETVASIAAKIETRLAALGTLQVFTGIAPARLDDVSRPVAELYPDPGNAVRARLAGGSRTIVWNERIVLSGLTVASVLAAVEQVRGQLVDWRPDPSPASSPLNEIDSGGTLLPDTNADLAGATYSFTLHYRMHLSRSTQA